MSKIIQSMLQGRDGRDHTAVQQRRMTETWLGEAPAAGNDIHLSPRRQKKRQHHRAGKRRISPATDGYLVALNHTNTAAAEQYRRLYSEIVRAERVRKLRTLLVTSALAGEGKTLTAVNLAITMAASSHEPRVLLVEADFRRPYVQKLLSAQPACGLTDYLLGDVDSAQIIHPTPLPGLAVVYAGRRVKNPATLLNSNKIAAFFALVQDRYSYLIVDSSPTLLTSEPLALLPHVDAVVFVVHARKTPRDIITQAIELLGPEHIFGCVLNGMAAADSYYYRYYYDSEYYHANGHT